MDYCKACAYIMDITNNIHVENNDNSDNSSNKNNDKYNTESSDYDPSSELSSLSSDNIKNILNGIDINIDNNFNIDSLYKNPDFNNLSSNEQTIIVNRILTKTKQSSHNKHAYYYCNNCGYHEPIPKRTLIISKNIKKDNSDSGDLNDNNFINYINDPTYPKTRNYKCINNSCDTHKHPDKKLATFYRLGNSYNTRYICHLCNSFWSTA